MLFFHECGLAYYTFFMHYIPVFFILAAKVLRVIVKVPSFKINELVTR